MKDAGYGRSAPRDEARLTLEYLYRFKDRASILAEDNISRAIGCHRWDDVHLWHGVKARILNALEAKPRPPA